MTRLVLVLLVLPTLAGAQTPITRGPVPAGAKLAFSMPINVPNVTEALKFEARLSDNGIPLTAVTAATGLTCSSPAPTPPLVPCQWVLSASNLDALNMIGTHSLTLRIFRADVGETVASVPFVLTSPAGAPTDLRLIP